MGDIEFDLILLLALGVGGYFLYQKLFGAGSPVQTTIDKIKQPATITANNSLATDNAYIPGYYDNNPDEMAKLTAQRYDYASLADQFFNDIGSMFSNGTEEQDAINILEQMRSQSEVNYFDTFVRNATGNKNNIGIADCLNNLLPITRNPVVNYIHNLPDLLP